MTSIFLINKIKRFKTLLHDSGIFQQVAGLRLSDLLIAKNIDLMNKGNIAEIFTGVEMMKYPMFMKNNSYITGTGKKEGAALKLII